MPPKSKSEIICATDLQHESLAAESVAYKLAKALGCKLRLVHVDPTLENVKFYHSYAGKFIQPEFWNNISGELTAEKARKLRHRIHAIGAAADPDVTFDVLMGKPAVELLSLARNSRAKIELVILSKRKRNFFDEFLLGSIAHRLLESFDDIPVLLVPDKEEIFLNWKPRQFTVASQLNASDDNPARTAARFATAANAKLELVHVVQEYPYYRSPDGELSSLQNNVVAAVEKAAQVKLNDEATKLAVQPGQLQTEIIYGPTNEALVNRMSDRNSDLLVIGNHNPANKRHGVLGGIAGTLARAANFPLLIVPHSKLNERKECA